MLPPRSLISIADADLKVVAFVDGNHIEHSQLCLVTPDDVFVYDEDLRNVGATKAAAWLKELVQKNSTSEEKKVAKRSRKATADRPTSPRSM